MKLLTKKAAKRMLLAISVIFITFTATACRNQDYTQEQNGDRVDTSTDTADSVIVSPVVVPDDTPTFSITDIELFPYNFRSSQNIGRTAFSGNAVLIPRIARGYRFSQELIGESGDPLMGSSQNWEYWDMTPPLDLIGPHGESFRVSRDIEYGVDFFSYPVFDLFAMDIDDPMTNLIVSGMPLDLSTVFTGILAVDVCEAEIVTVLTEQRNQYGERTIYLHRYDSNAWEFVSEHIIDLSMVNIENPVVVQGWFTIGGNLLLKVEGEAGLNPELLLLSSTGDELLKRYDTPIRTFVTVDNDSRVWRSITDNSYTTLQYLDQSALTWVDDIKVPVARAIGLHAAPQPGDFAWFVHTDNALYGIMTDGTTVRYILWADAGVSLTELTEIHIVDDNNILIIKQAPHPWQDDAVTLLTYLLYRTDIVDERIVLTVGGVNISNADTFELMRRFNIESTTHRAELVDFADEDFFGAVDRLRIELIRGGGPDVILFNQWGDENDLTHALMRGGFLADLHVFLDNDPELSREDFFTNIFDVWTNNNDELFLVTGAVTPSPFWGPGEHLVDFTDFTHGGFLSFLRNAAAAGVAYPAGLNFLPVPIFSTMLFADDTFFCFETDFANFDSELFIDILNYANNISEFQASRWTEALRTGEALNPIPFMARGEQLMSNLFGFTTVSDFRAFDFAVGAMTPIGAPNAAGELAISMRPISRMGIRTNSPSAEAAWELLRLDLLNPNAESALGLPTKRAIFESYIDRAMYEVAFDFFGLGGGGEIPAFTEERAAVLRHIMENITHEDHPDPHIMSIILEETPRFFAGDRSAEDTARVIQSRVSIYISEHMR